MKKTDSYLVDRHTDGLTFRHPASTHLLGDCQCDLNQWGLVNSLVLALICMCARVTTIGVPRR